MLKGLLHIYRVICPLRGFGVEEFENYVIFLLLSILIGESGENIVVSIVLCQLLL